LQLAKQLLHLLRLVVVGAQLHQDLSAPTVGKAYLEFGHLARNVPHEAFVQEFHPIRTNQLGQGAQLCENTRALPPRLTLHVRELLGRERNLLPVVDQVDKGPLQWGVAHVTSRHLAEDAALADCSPVCVQRGDGLVAVAVLWLCLLQEHIVEHPRDVHVH
ncbi:unnamed protein product, partial [Ixodes persulcatus]